MHRAERDGTEGVDMRRTGGTAAAIVICAGALVAGAAQAGAAAAAKKTTMHFFSRQVYSRLSDANGRRLPAGSLPATGDRVSYANDDYSGNHLHHASRAAASDRTNCTVVTPSSVLCDGTIAIGGAMILADDYVLTFPSSRPTTTVQITGGTGIYAGARGKIIARNAGRGLDVTIEVTRRPPRRS